MLCTRRALEAAYGTAYDKVTASSTRRKGSKSLKISMCLGILNLLNLKHSSKAIETDVHLGAILAGDSVDHSCLPL